jgi:hypothetical protein
MVFAIVLPPVASLLDLADTPDASALCSSCDAREPTDLQSATTMRLEPRVG